MLLNVELHWMLLNPSPPPLVLLDTGLPESKPRLVYLARPSGDHGFESVRGGVAPVFGCRTQIRRQ